MALTTSERSAITKALAQGGAAAVRRLRNGVYAVRSASRPDVVHTVTAGSVGGFACTCEAGRHERVCWHAAAAYLARLEHTARVRVTGPGTRLPTDAAAVRVPRRSEAA
jgi:hypothetical protein